MTKLRNCKFNYDFNSYRSLEKIKLMLVPDAWCGVYVASER